jgi:hypothetical protein
MSERQRLPDRREAELVDFEHAGRGFTVTVGRLCRWQNRRSLHRRAEGGPDRRARAGERHRRESRRFQAGGLLD